MFFSKNDILITRVMNLPEEHIETLVKAGTIIGKIKTVLNDDDADEITNDVYDLIEGIFNVTKEVKEKVDLVKENIKNLKIEKEKN